MPHHFFLHCTLLWIVTVAVGRGPRSSRSRRRPGQGVPGRRPVARWVAQPTAEWRCRGKGALPCHLGQTLEFEGNLSLFLGYIRPASLQKCTWDWFKHGFVVFCRFLKYFVERLQLGAVLEYNFYSISLTNLPPLPLFTHLVSGQYVLFPHKTWNSMGRGFPLRFRGEFTAFHQHQMWSSCYNSLGVI